MGCIRFVIIVGEGDDDDVDRGAVLDRYSRRQGDMLADGAVLDRYARRQGDRLGLQ